MNSTFNVGQQLDQLLDFLCTWTIERSIGDVIIDLYKITCSFRDKYNNIYLSILSESKLWSTHDLT